MEITAALCAARYAQRKWIEKQRMPPSLWWLKMQVRTAAWRQRSLGRSPHCSAVQCCHSTDRQTGGRLPCLGACMSLLAHSLAVGLPSVAAQAHSVAPPESADECSRLQIIWCCQFAARHSSALSRAIAVGRFVLLRGELFVYCSTTRSSSAMRTRLC